MPGCTNKQLKQLGWGCLLLQPIALAYGRRGMYLFSTLLNVPIMIWTASSSSPGEWYAHRIIIGIVNAPIESLPEISVADLMFAHERGTWMAAYVLVLFESNFIAPLIAGWLNDAIGWRWTMKFGAIVAAVSFVILFFFMEETMYFRHMTDGAEPAFHQEEVRNDRLNRLDPEKPERPTTAYGDNDDSGIEKPVVSRSFASRFMPFRRLPGRPSVKQMFFMMIRPLLIVFKFPCVAWAGFIYGINLSWYQVLNGTASPVLSAPPYEWRSAYIGCIYVGPMVGAVFGCLWAGIAADKLALHLARRNGGIREPEQRLWPLVIAGIFTAAGLITWVSNKRSTRRADGCTDSLTGCWRRPRHTLGRTSIRVGDVSLRARCGRVSRDCVCHRLFPKNRWRVDGIGHGDSQHHWLRTELCDYAVVYWYGFAELFHHRRVCLHCLYGDFPIVHVEG